LKLFVCLHLLPLSWQCRNSHLNCNVFWDMTPSNLVDHYLLFRGNRCFHLQGRRPYIVSHLS
jgi:hypothetical protein